MGSELGDAAGGGGERFLGGPGLCGEGGQVWTSRTVQPARAERCKCEVDGDQCVGLVAVNGELLGPVRRLPALVGGRFQQQEEPVEHRVDLVRHLELMKVPRSDGPAE